jgi:hypothetical protein
MNQDRTPPPTLEEKFKVACGTPSDINEHLPILRELASKCDHVTEFGLRGANGSTIAFLAAQPDRFISWDIDPFSVVSQAVLDLVVTRGRTIFQPRCGDTLSIVIEPTDLLFIDTIHTFVHLKAELERHCDPIEQKVRKYIAFHDTVTFGTVGGDGSEPGLRAAIRWFQREYTFPTWELIEDRKNCNGLAVLRRIDVRD